MQKIMFNDKFSLTKAVLEGRKTQTRRTLKWNTYKKPIAKLCQGRLCVSEIHHQDDTSRYSVGETVAVAQSYYDVLDYYRSLGNFNERIPTEKELIFHNEMRIMESTGNDSAMIGDENKMFVRADLMPFQIRITGIRLERLQDISDDDCLKEGVQKCSEDHRIGYPIGVPFNYFICEDKKGNRYTTPREAYEALIDKISSKGTWDKNPWVFVYDFELVK